MDVSISGTNALDASQWREQMLSGKTSKKDQIDQVAKEFEGIMVRQYLDKALKPMDPESEFFGAKGSPMYDHLIKDTLATSITKSGALGFSSVLQVQLNQEASTLTKGAELHD